MNFIKFNFRLFSALIIAMIIFIAQPIFAQGELPTEPSWIANNWKALVAIFVGIYELIVRYYPTVNSISLLTLLMRILNALVPDRAANRQSNVSSRSAAVPGAQVHSSHF